MNNGKRQFAYPVGHSEKETVQSKLGASDGTNGIPFESISFGDGKTHRLYLLVGDEDPSVTMAAAPGGTVYIRNKVGASYIYVKQGTPEETNGSWVKSELT